MLSRQFSCMLLVRAIHAFTVALFMLLSPWANAPAQAACSAWEGNVVLNEYYFGASNPPGNFLEIYSGDPTFTAATWQNWSIDVYSALNTKTSYVLSSSLTAVQACVFGSQTYVTYSAVGGLESSAALVILRDAGGSPVDAFVFDNDKNIPKPWPTAAASYYPALASECSSLSGTLDAQELLYKTTLSQMNMLQISNYGNKDISRFPDGTGVWDISSNRGSGTTFSQCSPNNPTLVKTANVATALPGGSVVYTVKLTNGGKTTVSGVVVSDPVPSNWTFTRTVTVGTTSVAGQTLTWNVGSVAADASATMTVTATVPIGEIGGVYTNTASSTAGITPATSSSAPVTVIYPMPTTTSISPGSANVGAAAFTMTVNGSNFVAGSVVRFAGSNLVTTYISASQLTVTIPASFLIAAGTFSIDVVNPPVNTLGGGTSNAQLFTVGNPVGSFNAFETATAANAISGVIKTRIAGSAFSLDVVAISGGAQASGFAGVVKVELLGNSVSGVALDGNNCPVSSTLLQTVTPNPALAGGRSPVSFAAVADAWKDVRVRISYPAAAPTVTSCSTDNFAIRPNSFSLSVTDADWQTAGTTRMLVNTGVSGGNVHKAGQPFTLQATAFNTTAATTVNYSGTPSAALSVCAGGACTATFGAFSIGAGAAVAGVINSSAVTYSEVGSFSLQLQDQTFADVDAGDGSAADCAGRYVCSATQSVGRFVPDHFDTDVSGGMPCPAGLTCPCPSGLTCPPDPSNGFVYSGQPFTAQVTARNAAGGTTVNYNTTTGLSKTVTLSTWDALGGSTPSDGTLTANTIPSTAFSAGVATSTSTPVYTFPATPTIPTDIFIRAIDVDNISSLRATPSASVEGGIKVVSGRVKVSNAYGSELLPLPMLATMQFYKAAGSWTTSTTDSVTSFNTKLSTAGGNLVPVIVTGPLAVGNISVVGAGAVTVAGGLKSFTLNKPLTTGSADISLNAPAYLFAGSNAAGVDPSIKGRATFGVYKGSNDFIYQREAY